MLFLTRMFGVTGSDAEREPGAETECIETIVQKILSVQANTAAQQQRPFCRRTHVKGTSAALSSKSMTLGHDTGLGWRRGSQGEYLRPPGYIPPRCGSRMPPRR